MSPRMRLLVILGSLAVLVVGGARLRGPTSPPPLPVATAEPGTVGSTNAAQPVASDPVGVGVSDVHATVTPDGSTVLSVRLVAHVRAAFDVDPATIRFVLTPPGLIGTAGRVTQAPVPTAATAATGAASDTADFRLTFDLRGLSAAPVPGELAYAGGAPAGPGVWLLTVELRDPAGQVEHASTPVQVVAGA
jgi:hypothetical protein